MLALAIKSPRDIIFPLCFGLASSRRDASTIALRPIDRSFGEPLSADDDWTETVSVAAAERLQRHQLVDGRERRIHRRNPPYELGRDAEGL